MWNLVFLVPRGTNSKIVLHKFSRIYSNYNIYSLCNRPHDRVPLKEMKADWHSCLDNRVGFKVRIILSCSEEILNVNACSPEGLVGNYSQSSKTVTVVF